MKRTAVICVALLAGGPLLKGQEAPQSPAPAKQHEWLGQLVGEWEFEGELVTAPGQPPIQCKGSESVRAIGGFWVIAENRNTFMDVPITGVLTIGYDPQKEQFVGTWIDSMTSYLWSYEGTLDEESKVLTLLTEGPSPAGPDKLAKFRETIEIKSEDHKVFTSAIQTDDGEWMTFATIHYRRKK